jgi:uncharacterized protein (TIGR02594 family)
MDGFDAKLSHREIVLFGHDPIIRSEGGLMSRAVDIVREVAPHGKPDYVAAFEHGDGLLQQHEINTPNRLAHFLAQMMHECDALRIDWEDMDYSAARLVEIFGVGKHSAAVTEEEALQLAHKPAAIAERVYGLGNPKKARELGNTSPGDGFRYRGGGLLQTTGRGDYCEIGKTCGVDFEKQPELLLSAEHALKPALAEWTRGNLNVFADNNDFLAISKAINLGNPRAKGTPNGLSSRAEWLARIRPLIDVVEFKVDGAVSVSDTTDKKPAPVVVSPPSGAASGGLTAELGGRLLKEGDESDLVRAMQLALAKLGYPLKGTGYFGGATDAAVTDFQQRHHLEVDGIVGPETAGAIDQSVGSETPHSSDTPHNVEPASSDRPLWVAEGMKWIGTEEAPGAADNPVILEWAQEEGGEIAKDYKHDSIPWCSLYANMILKKVGLKGTETLWALDWNEWGVKLSGPAVGAFAPMKRITSDGKIAGHIVVVVGRDKSGLLLGLGGNQDDAVNIRSVQPARPLSFRWPNGVDLPKRVGFDELPVLSSDGQVAAKEG